MCSKDLNYVLYVSEHPTGLTFFETENHKRTNSDRRNVELSSIFKICMSLTHFSPVSPFYISFFRCLNVMQRAFI